MPFWIMWLKWYMRIIIGGLNVSNFIQKPPIAKVYSSPIFPLIWYSNICICTQLFLFRFSYTFWLYFACECPFYSCKLFLYGSVIHMHIQISTWFYRLYCSHAARKAGCCLHDICCLFFIGIFCCVGSGFIFDVQGVQWVMFAFVCGSLPLYLIAELLHKHFKQATANLMVKTCILYL